MLELAALVLADAGAPADAAEALGAARAVRDTPSESLRVIRVFAPDAIRRTAAAVRRIGAEAVTRRCDPG